MRVVVVVLVLVSFVLCSCGEGVGAESHSSEQGKAVDILSLLAKELMDYERTIEFQLPDLKGKVHTLKDHQNKIVLISIWALWCAPCVQELPSLARLRKELGSQDFEILGINIDEVSEYKKVLEMVEAMNLPFPILLDSEKETLRKYKITAIPHAYIINRQGEPLTKVSGSLEWDDPEIVEHFRRLMSHS